MSASGGFKLSGKIPQGCTATDMVLTITRLLRDLGVVGKFVEVFGDDLDHLSVTDRATISNMSPEFGCTVTYFPIDDQTLDYMKKTNRSPRANQTREILLRKEFIVAHRERRNRIFQSGRTGFGKSAPNGFGFKTAIRYDHPEFSGIDQRSVFHQW